jgi:hypothetical protein
MKTAVPSSFNNAKPAGRFRRAVIGHQILFTCFITAFGLFDASTVIPGDLSAGTGKPKPRRFFSDDSFWNQPIPGNPEIDPKSEYYISLLEKDPSGMNFGINLTRYTIPIFEVDAMTPRVTVRHHFLSEAEKKSWKTKREKFGHGREFDARPVPMPAAAVPDTGLDMHLALVDWNSLTAWDMWAARRLPDGAWESNTGMKYRLDGPGVFDRSEFQVRDGESIHFHGPGRAAGVPITAGLILYDEVRAGEIRHKIACATRFNAYKEFSFPAAWTDGHYPGGIPEGAVIQLDPALDLSQFDLLPGERAVARALQKYGMVNVDNAGGSPLYGENLNHDPRGRSWKGILREWDGGIVSIPLKHYRVLKIENVIRMGDGKRLTKAGDTHPF